MIEVRGLTVDYQRKARFGRKGPLVRALDSVDFSAPRGSIMGVTGPSGSGKSTLARCIAGLQRASSGAVEVRGPVQLVMQDPGASLNPRFSAIQAIEEPLRIRGTPVMGRAAALLESVALDPSRGAKRTSEFSGGERARIAIARALAAMDGEPGALIFDESFSSLDQETCEQMQELLLALRERWALTYVIVSHDLGLLRAMAADIVVLNKERG